ncbi:MAG: lysine exporter LysO family protein [Firmicutes bacterium]|nr:lysine exporter LysO family protein [Bacillota bacterium]
MVPLLLAVCLGAALGWFCDVSKWNARIRRSTRGFLILMLFFLGAQLGINTELHAKMLTLGFRGLMFSIFTIAGSMIAVYFLSPFLPSVSTKSTHEQKSSTAKQD